MKSKDFNQRHKRMTKAAQFLGARKFIILYVIIFTFWVAFNIISLVYLQVNPYVFILINLLLSGIVTLQAPIIIMSRNRQEEKTS